MDKIPVDELNMCDCGMLYREAFAQVCKNCGNPFTVASTGRENGKKQRWISKDGKWTDSRPTEPFEIKARFPGAQAANVYLIVV